MRTAEHREESAGTITEPPRAPGPAATLSAADLREGARGLAARQDVPFFPPCVYIEPTNACNCHCVICPRRFMRRAVGFMPFPLFRDLVGQIAALGPSEIRLFNFGEPLLHPQLAGMIALCRRHDLPVQFQTNGIHLTEPVLRRLFETGLDYLGVSVNGLTAAEYEQIRPGFSFAAVQENVRRARSLAAELRAPLHIHINAQILKSEKDRRLKDIETYVQSWSGIADSLSVSGLSLFPGIEYPAGGRLHTADLSHLPRRDDAQVRCTEPFDRLIVKWDGRVTACCADYDARFVVGDLQTQRLADVWNSPLLNRLRLALRERRFHRVPHCQTCPRFYSDEFTLLFTRTK